MRVTLPDGQVLSVLAPTKKVLKVLTEAETTDDLYDAVAAILSRNRGGIRIKSTDLEDIMDYEDLVEFLQTYTAFIKSITNEKN